MLFSLIKIKLFKQSLILIEDNHFGRAVFVAKEAEMNNENEN